MKQRSEQHDNKIIVDEVQKVKEAQRAHTIEDKLKFLLKYHPELKPYQKGLADIFLSLDAWQFHKIDYFLNNAPPQSLAAIKKEFKNRLKALESFRKKLGNWFEFEETEAFLSHVDKNDETGFSLLKIVEAVDDSIEKHKAHMYNLSRGRPQALRFDRLVKKLKHFWIKTLAHEKFFYDSYNQNIDLANEFVDNFILAEYEGKRVSAFPGLTHALTKFSDSRVDKKAKKISKVKSRKK